MQVITLLSPTVKYIKMEKLISLESENFNRSEFIILKAESCIYLVIIEL
jgi:hypothetical protein